VLQHFFGDVAGDTADRLVAGLTFRQLGNGVVAQIVEPEPCRRTLEALNDSLTLFVATDLAGILQAFTLGTRYRARQIPPVGEYRKQNF